VSGPERDELDREDPIARLLRRRVDGAEIPPFGAVEARAARGTSLPLALVSASVVVVLALLVGNLLVARRPTVAEPQRSAEASAATAASASPVQPAIMTDSDRFGFMWASRRQPADSQVQSESGQGRFALPTQAWRFSACSCAVSPDGRRIAYWAGGTELRVVDVTSGSGVYTAIYTAPANQRGSGLAWSSDGRGLLLALENTAGFDAPVFGPLDVSLLVMEANGGSARTLATRQGPSVYVPLGWDRTAGVAAAAIGGEGGYVIGYVTVRTSGDPAPKVTRIGAPSTSALMFVMSLQVARDQQYVLGVIRSDQGDTLEWWKLADPLAASTGPRLKPGTRPAWRPESTEIGWVDNNTLKLLDVERGVTTNAGTLPPADYPTLAFRADGSAMAAARGSSYVLLEIASARTADLSVTGYDIIDSVRYDGVVAPSGSPPPLNAIEQKIVDALASVGVRGQRAELPGPDSASMWVPLTGGSAVFVVGVRVGASRSEFSVLDERRVGATLVQHIRYPSDSSGRTLSRFECSGYDYRIWGAVPPDFASSDAFVDRFIGALSCGP
jgi:hypothetical protein